MNSRVPMMLSFLFLMLTSAALYAEVTRRPVRLEHVPFMHLSDEQIFACACPGAVRFCKRWDKEWRQDAAPEVKNQTVRECVIDFMQALEGP